GGCGWPGVQRVGPGRGLFRPAARQRPRLGTAVCARPQAGQPREDGDRLSRRRRLSLQRARGLPLRGARAGRARAYRDLQQRAVGSREVEHARRASRRLGPGYGAVPPDVALALAAPRRDREGLRWARRARGAPARSRARAPAGVGGGACRPAGRSQHHLLPLGELAETKETQSARWSLVLLGPLSRYLSS